MSTKTDEWRCVRSRSVSALQDKFKLIAHTVIELCADRGDRRLAAISAHWVAAATARRRTALHRTASHATFTCLLQNPITREVVQKELSFLMLSEENVEIALTFCLAQSVLWPYFFLEPTRLSTRQEICVLYEYKLLLLNSLASLSWRMKLK